MPVIKATEDGFHWLDALGRPLAPDAFLNGGDDPEGEILLTAPGTGWIAAGDAGGRVLLESDTALDPAEPGAGGAEIGITGITFQRAEGGDWVDVGRIVLAAPLRIEVVHDGWTGLWQGTVADALAEAVRGEGIVFEGGAGADVFDPGRDTLPIEGPQLFRGRGGDDVARTGRADAESRGGPGDDRLSDAGGVARLDGGPGDDRLELGAWSEGGLARGGMGRDLVISSNGDDELWGNAGDDRLQGGRGDDLLAGGPGADRLEGGEGCDTLRGGGGDDSLTGGWGADSFVFRAAQDGRDRITDFDPLEDRILLCDIAPGAVRLEQSGDSVTLSWKADATVVVEDASLETVEAALFLL